MKRAAISCLLIIMCAVKQSSGKPIEYSAWKKCKSVYTTIDLYMTIEVMCANLY